MPLRKLAIHQIHREEGEVKHNFSKKCLDVENQTTLELYGQLEAAFDRASNPMDAKFENAVSLFPAQLITYRGTAKSEKTFLEFNRNVLEPIKTKITNDKRFKGGFFIFTESLDGADELVDVFFIRDKRAVNFTWVDDHFNIKGIESFDTDKLVMSCQINDTQFSADGDGRCIYFYTSDTKERKFFYSWLAATEFESSKESTETVIRVLRNHPPKDPESGRLINLETRQPLEEDAQFDYLTYEKQIAEALEAQPGNSGNLRDVSNRIYQDENILETNIAAEEKHVPRQFLKHQPTVKSMPWINETADKVTLKFPRDEFEGRVQLEKQRGQLTGKITVTSMDLAIKIDREMNRP